jgi:hypothetical protein
VDFTSSSYALNNREDDMEKDNTCQFCKQPFSEHGHKENECPELADSLLEDAAKCADCGMLYGGYGWIEAIIPDKIWDRIRPEGKDKGCGILCVGCISKRLEIRGFTNIPVWLCGTEPLTAMSGDPAGNIDILRSYDQTPTK